MPITLNGDSGITTPTYGGTDTSEYLVPVTGFKNKLINGGFQIWQRGTSGGITGYSCADRFYFYGAGTTTVAKSSTPTSLYGNYYAQWTTGASSSYCNIAQAIESANVTPLRGQAMVVTCWVKLIAGTYTAGIQLNATYSNSSDAFSLATSIPVQSIISAPAPNSSWQEVKTTFTVPTDAVGLTISLNNQSAQASGVTLAVADFQLEKGSTATSFDYRPYGTELQLCQRYYFKLLTPTGSSAGTGYCITTSTAYIHVPFPVTMRVAPTALETTGTATDYQVRTANGGGTAGVAVPTYFTSTTGNAVSTFTVGAVLVAGNGTIMRSNSASAYLAWSAEL